MSNTGFATVDTYRFIADWALAHKGNTPSLRQIAQGCGFSGATAHYHIQVLIKQGLLERIDGALCVVRLQIIAPDNIYDMKSPERIYPEFRLMKSIPKEMTWMKTHPKEMGIAIGDAIDEEFLQASYPLDWKFLCLAFDKITETHQLVDEGGVPRAMLDFNTLNYTANIHFWG